MAKNKFIVVHPDPVPEPEEERELEEVEEEAEVETEEEAEPEEEPAQQREKEGLATRAVNFFSGMAAQKMRLITGLLFLTAGLFLLVAFVSHFLYWWMDYDAVQQLSDGGLFSRHARTVRNWSGGLGALTAFNLINKGFGIASFIFPVILLQAGLHILYLRKFHWGKILFRSAFGLLFISTLTGCFFNKGTGIVFSGDAGVFSALYLRGLLGWAGLAGLLFFCCVAYIIVNFNVNRWIRKIRKERKEKTQKADAAEAPQAPVSVTDTAPVQSVERTADEPVFTISEVMGLNKPAEDAMPEEEPLPEQPEPEEDAAVEEESEADSDFEIIDLRETGQKSGSEKDLKKIQHGDHLGLDTKFDPRADLQDYKFPTLDLLDSFGNQAQSKQDMEKELQENKENIKKTLGTFGIEISKISATIGPTVTLYEIVPAPGIRINKIKNLEDDIALSLSALGIRIIAPIPGKGTIGIEVPNMRKQIVPMRDMLTSAKFTEFAKKAALPIALGKTISNEEYVADLAKMPHLLVAGATGQGKSVGLNAIIASLLYSKHPAELKFVMVDPKKVELSLFNKIERHYLAKLPPVESDEEAVITDTRKVVRTLNSLCIEMDNRYLLLKQAGAKKINEYNDKFIERKLNPAEEVLPGVCHRYLPYIVLIIDEFADLIMTAGKEVEMPIARLAQLARAVGIHLVIATQRPSVNVITGTIKANFPARIAFKVQSQVDSRTILDNKGANQLIGKGDMLISAGEGLVRVQCALIDTPEIERIADFIGEQRGYPTAFALPDVPDECDNAVKGDVEDGEWDPIFREAAEMVVSSQQSSTSLLQRKFKLGYNRAGRVMDQLEQAGVVGPFDGRKIREVKIKDPVALEELLNRLGI